MNLYHVDIVRHTNGVARWPVLCTGSNGRQKTVAQYLTRASAEHVATVLATQARNEWEAKKS